MKEIAHGLGYLIGALVIIPLIIWIANTFILVGNDASEQQVKEFINNCYMDTITSIPETILISDDDEFNDYFADKIEDFKKRPYAYTEETSEQYWARLSRGNSTGFMYSYTFYSNKYKKYLSVKTFDITDKYDTRYRDIIFGNNPTFTALINKDLLADSSYGTQKKPLPVFPRELIDIGGSKSWLEEEKKWFYISDTLNFIFVREYLNHFLPKEDFKKMFEE